MISNQHFIHMRLIFEFPNYWKYMCTVIQVDRSGLSQIMNRLSLVLFSYYNKYITWYNDVYIAVYFYWVLLICEILLPFTCYFMCFSEKLNSLKFQFYFWIIQSWRQFMQDGNICTIHRLQKTKGKKTYIVQKSILKNSRRFS